ncbi:hypothetical protein CA51_13090 [Rosistilla oblonga]|nr:hypothetical protein CA51_13090 [Rosistilla oblonga]
MSNEKNQWQISGSIGNKVAICLQSYYNVSCDADPAKAWVCIALPAQVQYTERGFKIQLEQSSVGSSPTFGTW